MRILVTGATGFLGNAVASELARAGHETIGLIRNEAHRHLLARQEISAVKGTLSSIAEYRGILGSVECIVHCAADHSVDSHALDGQFLTQLFNYFGSARPLPLKCIFTSGSWIYGNRPNEVLSEDSPPNPPAFVAGRVSNEQRVLDHGGYVVRPPLLYGLSGSLTALWFEAAHTEGSVWIPGSGNNTVSMLHVLDAARFYRLLAEAALSSAAFNIASSDFYSLLQCAEAVQHVVGCRAPVRTLSIQEARAQIGVLADGLAFSQELASLRAGSLLHWKSLQPSFVDGIARYHAAWHAHTDRRVH